MVRSNPLRTRLGGGVLFLFLFNDFIVNFFIIFLDSLDWKSSSHFNIHNVGLWIHPYTCTYNFFIFFLIAFDLCFYCCFSCHSLIRLPFFCVLLSFLSRICPRTSLHFSCNRPHTFFEMSCHPALIICSSSTLSS